MAKENKNMYYYNAFKNPPQNARKTFNNGKMKGTDTNPMWRIKALTEMFGPCGFNWYYEISNKWRESVKKFDKKLNVWIDEDMAFLELNLYIKDVESGEWSKPIVGIGGNSISGQLDEAYKGAFTDAFSIACKHLGMCADIWYGADADNSNDTSSKYSTYYGIPQPPVQQTHPPQVDEEQQVINMIQNVKSQEELIALWASIKSQYGNNSKIKKLIVDNPFNPKR